MKKFINQPEHVVEEMLQGFTLLHPGSARLTGHSVIVRADAEQVRDRQVAILSGGGSGHEPAHAGYVGAGMLSAAVAGEVFTSPSSDSVFAALQAVAGKPGALLVVKNYTGDRLNFGLAAEMARAEGIAVDMLIVDDDVALQGTRLATGARGLAGVVFIHKLLGAAAREGKMLAELSAIGRGAVASLATMGVSLSAGTSPAVGKPSFELGQHEMELGLGIHGEPGVQRTELQAADQLTETLLTTILQHRHFNASSRLAVMVNNLGATTQMELAIIARHAVSFLASKGFTIERLYAGTFLSSLDMAGVSISLLGVSDEWLRWLDTETSAPGWPNVAKQPPGKPEFLPRHLSKPLMCLTRYGRSNENFVLAIQIPAAAITSGDIKGQQAPCLAGAGDSACVPQAASKLRDVIESACRALIAAEPELTELDRITGDGDLGISMQRAAKAILAAAGSYPLDNLSVTLQALAHTLRRELGGSSGPLYGILCLRVAIVLEAESATGIESWAHALAQGCEALSQLGGAKPGDRTMLDALLPFVETLRLAEGANASQTVIKAVEAADRGVANTAQMQPRVGRSSYLGDRVLGHPDPGARALAIWLRAVAEAIYRQQ